MFSFFKKTLAKLGQFHNTYQPLRNDELGEFLYTLHLKHVDNVLDADALWEESSYAGQANIRAMLFDEATQTQQETSDYRLYRALQDHPRIVSVKDAAGVTDQAKRIFTDVVIWIPKLHWENDARQGGHKLYIMAERLAHAHQRDLGKNAQGQAQLLNGRTPRYCIMPESQLARNEVICQFGLGVFVPDRNDARNQLAHFYLRKAEQGFQFPEWIFFEQGQRVTRPIGWYAGQQFLHLAQDASYRMTCIQAPTWFGHGKGYIQLALNHHAENPHAQSQQMYADESYIAVSRMPYDGDAQRIICEYHSLVPQATHIDTDSNPNSTPESLYLDIVPHENLLTPSRQAMTSASNASQRLMEMTIVGGVNHRSNELCVIGFVLPKLNTEYANSGIHTWQLTLDAQGNLLTPEQYSTTPWLRFLARTDDEGWYYQTDTMAQPEAYHGAQEYFCGDFCYHILPAISPDNQYALLRTNQLQRYPLQESIQILGRHQQSNAIPLTLLDKAGTLLRQDGSDFGRTLQDVGFSSQHAELQLQLQENQLRLRQLSKSSPIYLLDEALQLKDKLAPQEQRELTLAPREGMIIGSYVLQFQ